MYITHLAALSSLALSSAYNVHTQPPSAYNVYTQPPCLLLLFAVPTMYTSCLSKRRDTQVL